MSKLFINYLSYEFLDCAKYKVKKRVLLAPMDQGGLNVPRFCELSLASKFTGFRKLLDQKKLKVESPFVSAR